MIKVYHISNLKIVYDSYTGNSVVLEKSIDENNTDNELRQETPLFSADTLTDQEKYLLKELLFSYSWNENQQEKENLIKSLEVNSADLLTVISELNEQLIQYKNECAALEAEISDLRQNKSEIKRTTIEEEDS